jgi:hypothetical protein
VKRFPQLAFAALLAATVAAFFITQHLKVSTPLVTGVRGPSPAVFNPLAGTTCGDPPVDFRRTAVSFYLLHRSDDVDVYIVDQGGNIVRTLAAGVHMQGGAHPVPAWRKLFVWNGREDSGRLAPDGIYYVRVALIHQGRTVTLSDAAGPKTVKIKTVVPAPVVRSAVPHLIPAGPRTSVTITYAGNEHRGGTVRIYRTDLPGWWRRPPVKSFLTPWRGQQAVWNGQINRRPAPAGTYLVGLDVTDAACNTGHFPVRLPPPPGSTPGAGVTVRYVAVEPPLDPVAAGSRATVFIDSRRRPYSWSLYRTGARKPLASGHGDSFSVRVPVPRTRAGAYQLTVRADAHATTVPLVAHAARPAPVLVVLPALTWQGLNPVDDDGDGIPNTLSSGGEPIKLTRPLVDGLPSGFGDEAALLAYLDSSHHTYDLTTDLGLLDGVGPALKRHRMVILAGTEQWLPQSMLSGLRAYTAAGGHVLSLGIGSLLRTVTVSGGQALDPSSPAATDALGAVPHAVVAHNHELLGVLIDGLGIFSTTSGVFAGFPEYQPFATSSPHLASEAGVSSTAPAIIGYRLGRGTVVDIGVPGFASHLAHDVDAKELVNQVWTVLDR